MTPDASLGPDGAQVSWHGFADYLRRALHAVADQIEPQADGLAAVRARIPGRPRHWRPPAGAYAAGPDPAGTARRRERRLGVPDWRGTRGIERADGELPASFGIKRSGRRRLGRAPFLAR